MQLAFSAIDSINFGNRRIKLLPPTILKPYKLWTGKQVISTLLVNLIGTGEKGITFRSKTMVKKASWRETHNKSLANLDAAPYGPMWTDNKPYALDEQKVFISNSIMLQGILDKSQMGAKKFGLIHYVFELHGAQKAGQLLTALTRLGTEYLKLYQGFTLGHGDVMINPENDKNRKKQKVLLNKGRTDKFQSFYKIEDKAKIEQETKRRIRQAHADTTYFLNSQLDTTMRQLGAEAADRMSSSAPHNEKHFPFNNLGLMIEAGAKGGVTHREQMGVFLGQMELEGKRPPAMPTGRRLPCFSPYVDCLRSGGFISDRFGTGLRPPEMFFNCQASREGLIDTAVKTSRSGYLQRSLMKVMEGLIVNHDCSVRDPADESIIQFVYGEDGINPQRSIFTNTSIWPFYVDNVSVLQDKFKYCDFDKKGNCQNQRFTDDQLVEVFEEIKGDKEEHGFKKKRRSGFNVFCEEMKAEGSFSREELIDKWYGLKKKEKKKYMPDAAPDPIMSKQFPASTERVQNKN